MRYVFGPPSTATPAERKVLGIAWCDKCMYETLEHNGLCGLVRLGGPRVPGKGGVRDITAIAAAGLHWQERLLRDGWSFSEGTGWVYFIQAGYDGAVKIGYTGQEETVWKRLEMCQVGNPRKLEVLALFRGPRTLEAALHRHFKPWRLQGEWFKHTAPGLDALVDLARRQPETWMDKYVKEIAPWVREKVA